MFPTMTLSPPSSPPRAGQLNTFLSLSFILSLQAFPATTVSLGIGTCPTQAAVSRVTATLWVPSAHSVSLRGGSVSVSRGWGGGAVTRVAVALMD